MGSLRAQGVEPNIRETSILGVVDGGKGGHMKKVSLGSEGGGRRGWVKQKSRHEERLSRLRTGVEAKEEREETTRGVGGRAQSKRVKSGRG